MNKTILGSLILVLLISGCTGLPDISSIFGGNPSANVTKLGPDVIVIQTINVIPKASLRPEDTFSVFFEVKNQDEDKRVPNVRYDLFDRGLCGFEGDGGKPDPNLHPGSFGDFSPSETRLVEWNFRAPTEADMVGLRITCPIRFKIIYDYNATSQIDVDVINPQRLTDLQRSGKDVTYVPSLSVGRGPLKIYFDFGNTLPVRAGGTLTFYVKVKDEGAGLYGEISNETGKNLVINADDFSNIDCVSEYFNCPSSTSCENKQTIPLINKETFDMRCTATAPSGVTDEQTFYINARILNYEYPVLGQASVEVKP
jgi:hypothetical protein